MTKGVPAVLRRKRCRKRGIVPTGGMAPLSPKELKHHARLLAEGKPMSGRSGPFVYYMLNGKQRWRRYSVPRDPRTAHQQRSRAAFRAASKTWSQEGPLTDKQRDAWYADGAKRRSRSRLGQSGPLTGQQNYIGRNSTRKQRDYQMLSHPRQREQDKGKNKRLKSELTAQVSRSQPITRPTSGTRRALTVAAPSTRRVPRGACKETQDQAVNGASASSPEIYATHVRPPPDQHQTASGAAPAQSESTQGHWQAWFTETPPQTSQSPRQRSAA